MSVAVAASSRSSPGGGLERDHDQTSNAGSRRAANFPPSPCATHACPHCDACIGGGDRRHLRPASRTTARRHGLAPTILACTEESLVATADSAESGWPSGRWFRPDGGYILAIRDVDAAVQSMRCIPDPRPIPVARAATRDSSTLRGVRRAPRPWLSRQHVYADL